jgi:ribonuclease HI
MGYVLYRGKKRVASGRGCYCFTHKNTTVAECIAILMALKEIKRLGVKDVCVFTDCKAIADKVNNWTTFNSVALTSVWFGHVKSALSTLYSSIRWVPRGQNQQADHESSMAIPRPFRRRATDFFDYLAKTSPYTERKII